MNFKGWKCKQCGSADFALLTKDNSTQKGIYCNSCGKWLKWFLQKPTKFLKALKALEICAEIEKVIKE